MCPQGKRSDCTQDTSPRALQAWPPSDAQLMSSQGNGQYACGMGQNAERDRRLGSTPLRILSCETVLVCHLRRGMRRAARRAAPSRRAASLSACWTATASARCPPRPCPQSAPPAQMSMPRPWFSLAILLEIMSFCSIKKSSPAANLHRSLALDNSRPAGPQPSITGGWYSRALTVMRWSKWCV